MNKYFLIFLRNDQLLLSKKNYSDWKDIQDEYEDYMSSLEFENLEEAQEYLSENYGLTTEMNEKLSTELFDSPKEVIEIKIETAIQNTEDFNFYKTTMPKTRKADYYLGCLDDCVFIDFNQSEDKRILLVRISFDGYGCCNMSVLGKGLNHEDSKIFIRQMNKAHLNQEIMSKLVKHLIQLNKEHLWMDAIEEYGLI